VSKSSSLSRTDVKLAELRGHSTGIYGATFNPGGQFIVTASSADGVQIWDADSGRSLVELPGKTDAIRSAVFSPDGESILIASDTRGQIYPCIVCAALGDLLTLAQTQVTRELSPSEIEQYLHE
jgi:WD40 repeat protein